MEIDFYENFDCKKSVSVGKKLWHDILQIEYLDQINDVEDIIPEGHDGEGEKIERIHLEEIRNQLINGFSQLLTKYSKKSRDETNIKDLSTILEILISINTTSITHMKFDI
ncbi:hypothetical protein [Psychrobacter aquimaris]|uniref:hypothetical protein n=1 Tax=Psychrobacter aquimaris TaxID=292733 RepID=UPI0039C65C1C